MKTLIRSFVLFILALTCTDCSRDFGGTWTAEGTFCGDFELSIEPGAAEFTWPGPDGDGFCTDCPFAGDWRDEGGGELSLALIPGYPECYSESELTGECTLSLGGDTLACDFGGFDMEFERR